MSLVLCCTRTNPLRRMLSPGPIVGPACKYTARAAYDCEITVSRSRTGRHPIAHLKTSSPSHLVRFFSFFFPVPTISKLLVLSRAAIRQRTYQALVALHLSPPTFPRTPPQLYSQAQQSVTVPLAFPLSMSKVVKAVCRERDGSCLCVLFKLLRRLIHVSPVASPVECSA